MPEIQTEDAVLHVEIDGEGEPVTVLAHGLTNSCNELAAFTPMVPGTKVRFCFRGHGHSSTPASGYRFADFARDLDAVAASFGATRAVGTSLGAGAICHLLERRPDRFERLVFLLPAALDLPFGHRDVFLHTAKLLETLPKDEAIEAILSDGGRLAKYEEAPWLRDFDLALWEEMNPVGVARAIREVVDDTAVRDRESLRAVSAPVLIVCREGDLIHPAELGRILAGLLPNAELIVAASEDELIATIPSLVTRVAEFLS
ncbi:MAG TPA: alpha/beta fold hydrolase [Actinomycetota bacterium]